MANFFATAPLANFHPFRSTTQIWAVEFLHSFFKCHFAGNRWWSHKNMVFAVRVIIFNTYQKRLCCCLLILFSYAVKPSLDIAIWKCRYTNFYLMYTGINFLHWYRCCMQTCLFSNFADELRRQILFKSNWKYIIIEGKKSKQNKENYSLIVKKSFFSTKNIYFF